MGSYACGSWPPTARLLTDYTVLAYKLFAYTLLAETLAINPPRGLADRNMRLRLKIANKYKIDHQRTVGLYVPICHFRC